MLSQRVLDFIFHFQPIKIARARALVLGVVFSGNSIGMAAMISAGVFSYAFERSQNGFGPKSYKNIGFDDIHGPKPYKFIGFGDIHGPKPYKFIGFGDMGPQEGRVGGPGRRILP